MTNGKITRNHAVRCGLTASILGALGATTGLSAEFDQADWLNDETYMLLISHMPDFDQRRGGPNGLVTSQTVGGGTHCGPTSGANLLAYISTHGFPQIDPMQADYADTGNTVTYNRVTELVRDLGVEMNVDNWTDGNGNLGLGTNQNSRANAMRARLSEHFTIANFRRPGNHAWWPSLDSLARAGIDNGAIMSLGYGYYDWSGDAENGINLVQRNGGHAVTLTAAAAYSGRMVLGVSDPTTDSGENNRTQSDFEISLWDVDEFPVIDAGGNSRNAFFLSDGNSASQDGSSDRVLEGYISIQPRTGLSWDRYDDSFLLAGPTFGAWSEVIDPIRASGSTRSRIRDLQYDPDMLDAILLDEDDRCLIRFPVGSDHPRRIKLEYDDGKIDAFSIDRHRNLIVFSDRAIRRYNIDDPCDPTFEGAIPARATTVHVNDARDEILVVMGDINAIGRFTDLHAKRPRMQMMRLPRNLNWREASGILQFDDGTILINMKGGGLYRLEQRGRSMQAEPVILEGLPRNSVSSIAVDDLGTLLVSAGGRVNAYTPRKQDGRFVLDPSNLFHGLECGERFVPSRSRSNLDDTDAAFKNNEVGDRRSTRVLKRCRGDVNWDQRVDERDIDSILSAIGETRGPEDLNRDGIVNVLDIVIATSNFGACD